MTEKNAFDRQLEREIDRLAGPEPRVDVSEIVAKSTRPALRPRFAWLTGSLRLAMTTAVIAVFGLVLALDWLGGSDQDAGFRPGVAPGATPSPELSPSPGVGTGVPVTGTWSSPEPATCETTEQPTDEPWLLAATDCPGLRFGADDPRLAADGAIRREEWADGGPSSEIWTLANRGGKWESRRYHVHERLVLVGFDGYAGMTAVLTLTDEGAFSGFIQTKPPAEDPEG